MTQKDINRIETFVRWLNGKNIARNSSIYLHDAPVGKMKASGKYKVESSYTDDGKLFFTAKPKDKRLEGLVYFGFG